MRSRRLIGVGALLLVSFHAVREAHAEGSAEFDARDLGGYGAHDQAVHERTVMYVDILDSNNEKICWRGNGSLTVKRPNGTTLATLPSSNAMGCVNTPDNTNGAYEVDMLSTQAIGTEWDIRVCADTTDNPTCRTVTNDAVERKGRLWSYTWDFESNTSFAANRSVMGSVYAIVPGGASGNDAVIEMRMEGVSGAYYKLFANGIGPETTGGVRVGRSTPTADHAVDPTYPLYLSPPAKALYNWITPQVTNVVLTPSCGTSVVQGSAPGTISFNSNLTGSYIVVCDTNTDSVYDFASATDWSSFGDATPGANTITWNGTNNSNANVTAPATYNCRVRLNVGEFHYIAQDIETSYPGIRMFRVESDKTTRTAVPMFWDDRSAPAEVRSMPNMRSSPIAPPPDGMDPQSYATASAAFYFNGTTPVGNARAWGDFNAGGATIGDGKGNNAFLDTFAAADFASAPFTISVLTAGGDADGDTLSNSAECAGGTDPQDVDTDNDGVNDNVDTAPLNANVCRDLDDDDCDDCSITGDSGSGPSISNDGTDTDGDNLCNSFDTDDDNDGIPDGSDTSPLLNTECADSDGDQCDDCSAGMGANAANDGPDFDGDGECDIGDADDDNDGISDAVELGGVNLSLDSDDDGVPDWNDPQSVSCPDTAPPIGTCDSLPASLDPDGDGTPNQRDLDSDGDGLTDARESFGTDDNGDGRPDGCLPINTTTGACASGLVVLLPNTDGPSDAIPNVLDLDSDGDGITDHVEAYDSNGDGVSDRPPTGSDTDDDGIDDAFDPSCAGPGDCGGTIGTPVTSPLSAARDANGDTVGDWLQLCGDAYVTGSESCDDANAVDTDACSNLCRRGLAQSCTLGTQCESGMCDGTLGTCQLCLDSQASGTDTGCSLAQPTCAVIAGENTCVVCANTQSGVATDDGCSGATPLCDPAQAGGLGACFACLADGDCDDGDDCTTDTCTGNSCSSAPAAAGTSCNAGAGVCDGEVSPACVECIDDQTGTNLDSGCASGTPICDQSGASPVCVECLSLADCPLGAYCTELEACEPGCAVNTDCARTPATPLCNTAAPSCVQCLVDADCPGVQVCGGFSCSSPDSDGDGVPDDADVDDDNDGLADVAEFDGIDLSLDSDSDGMPDYRDPDAVGCTDTAPADGDCDVLPSEIDADEDGAPNHLDRDSDGDGLTDAREGGGEDPDGDGEPDGCLPVTAEGACSGGASDTAPNSDDPADSTPDFLDLDSDADAISDHIEAYDDDGDGVSDNPESGLDTDGDGIDDAFDPDCAPLADCGGVIGAPVVEPLDAARDSDGDDTPDWLQTCGDAYVSGDEACDDGDGDDGNACTNACLRGDGVSCTTGSQCESAVCDGALGTCQRCSDTQSSGIDAGCPVNLPTCTRAGDDNLCVVCADTQTGLSVDDGCGLATPICDPSQASGAGACVMCLTNADCDDSDDCTVDMCSAGVCSHPSAFAGTSCDGGAGVCDGAASSPACVTCIDDESGPETDSGCDGDAPFCEGSGATLACVECRTRADCAAGDYCTSAKTCAPGCAGDDDCAGAPLTPLCDVPNSACVECLVDAGCPGVELCTAGNTCSAPDSDADGVPDDVDVDDDNDGLADAVELGGTDLTLDSDDDGIPDYRDPDAVGCEDTSPADGDCDVVPSAIDADGDGVPNHLDLDSDDDGLTDAREVGGEDADGDGIPDGCFPVTDSGACASGLVSEPPNSDDDELADAWDPDSDGDGITDYSEAYDEDGDGTPNNSRSGSDADGDGIDDLFDPDCATALDCGGTLGTPVTDPLSSWRDDNGDGTPDWLQRCGDAYTTGAEACDDANADDADDCTSQCLVTVGRDCESDAACASMLCDAGLGTCQGCLDDSADGTDTGCSGEAPACDASSSPSYCVACTLDSNCSSGVCAAHSCVPCADDKPGTELDRGCSDGAPICTGSGASARCVACVADADCGAGSCIDNVCQSGCAGDAHCSATPATPFCAMASRQCVQCTSDAHCPGWKICTDAFTCRFEDYDVDGRVADVDIDDDGDGIPDADELGGIDRSRDSDRDGIPDYVDPDAVECDAPADAGECAEIPERFDIDRDGVPNHLDLDSDDDGIPDATEGHDEDLDGVPDREPAGRDTDRDGLDDAFDRDCREPEHCDGTIGVRAPRLDTDDDGVANFLDADDDGDERTTREERDDADAYDGPAADPSDIDGDGPRNWYDIDADGDTALDITENMDGGDANDDGLLDYLDPEFRATDTDGDGVLDVVECRPPSYPDQDDCRDTDGDGRPDYDDPDDDGDGIPTAVELAAKPGTDVDRDGTPNYLDRDSDGDGISDRIEANLDIDEDGVPDYVQKTEVGFAGGALCSLLDGPRSSARLGLIAGSLGLCVALLGFRRVRTRTRSDRSRR